MVPHNVREYLKELITKQLNASIGSLEAVAVGGGSINDTFRLTVNHRANYFLKLNQANTLPGLFEKEKDGLEFLRLQDCIRTPAVIACSKVDYYQLLLLEWIDTGIRTESFWKKFGEQLACLHHKSNQDYGFAEDNYMGSLPQSNDLHSNWIRFFIDQRLRPQIHLALSHKLLQQKHIDLFESVFRKLDTIFNNEPPALLHGDLWSGNFICDSGSTPVLIDPAVYFGHRSVDLGMTTLFGGFDKSFYEAYDYYFPLPSNYHDQWEICNLYPLLIHLNLFGTGYLYDITETIKKFS